MSPKKRKAVSNAKKAMRMHHREGITLKQAWKKVNRFGYTVCEKGMTPNPNWVASGGRGKQCIKECPPGTIRNYSTGRCRKIIGDDAVVPPGYEPNPNYTIGSNRQPFVKSCPPGSFRTASGKCKKIDCGPGKYKNPNTGKCVNVKGAAMPYSLIDTTGLDLDFGKTLGMGGTYRRQTDFGKTLGMGGTYRRQTDFGKTLGMGGTYRRQTDFGRRSHRCGFGTCAACKGK